MLEMYVGNVCGKCMWEMWEVCWKKRIRWTMESRQFCILSENFGVYFVIINDLYVFEKSKMTLKNRKLFNIIYKGRLRDEVICNGGCIMAEERIKVNYKPLWKLLIDRDISKGDLRRDTKIAASTFTKMMNNENVSLDVLVRICVVLNCGLDDIVEIEK